MRAIAIALLAAGLFVGAGGAPAQEPDSPGDLAVEGVAKLVDALRRLLESVPQYEAPEITEDGDIIIRRRRPEPEEAPAEKGKTKPEIDET